MLHKFSIISALIISTTCMVIPFRLPFFEDPNYSFSYNVNEGRTGDIKSQQETRHGGTVTGQYSLVQPDGIRRTVDYRADDFRGFRATVNNNRDINRQQNDNTPIDDNVPVQWLQPVSSTDRPAAISRSSIFQTIDNRRVDHPWA